MKPELRDKLIVEFDAAAKWAGAATFEEGIDVVIRATDLLQQQWSKMRTKEELARLLDGLPEPTRIEEKLILATIKFLPQILRFATKQVASQLEKEVSLPAGRPNVELQRRAEIVAYVGKLHIESYSLEISKRRAAGKFHVSESTVQRIWDDRGSIDEADFRSALKWLIEQ